MYFTLYSIYEFTKLMIIMCCTKNVSCNVYWFCPIAGSDKQGNEDSKTDSQIGRAKFTVDPEKAFRMSARNKHQVSSTRGQCNFV